MADISKKKLAFFLVVSTLLITFVFYGYQVYFTPNILVDRESRIFIIRSGYTFRNVQEELAKGNFVNDMVSFSFLARFKDYHKNIRPGRYLLTRNMTNAQALSVLQTEGREAVRITFNNIRLKSELAEKLTKNTGVTIAEFNEALDRFVAANTEGFTQQNVLSMFLPNTYEVYYNVLPEELIERMHSEYKKFWNDERKAKAANLGLTPLEISTLASIVQAESIKPEEAPIIAGLYINRLKKNMPLQADPTLVFASGDFTLKRVLNVHKEIDSPYNTYKYAGLPPGPINMPQLTTLDAVLDYQQHSYLYMCAREDFSGFHNFAGTLEEHNRNAAKYQRALSIEIAKGRAQRGEKK
ncbi:MAG: endolytic transglycosylase MltG [Cyclobacteriaceae bacterium]|nr:endolytic transglycosylase MltG [Cyclobacteriaceae bacterium]